MNKYRPLDDIATDGYRRCGCKVGAMEEYGIVDVANDFHNIYLVTKKFHND